MKLLNGKELAEYIKERQAKQARGLFQAQGVKPKLAIIRTNPDPVVDSYMKLKQSYGRDIGVDVEVHSVEQVEAMNRIKDLNADKSVHGIIVQIPLPDRTQTDEILNAVVPEKDVDALGAGAIYDPATPMAIAWLLAGYNIDLRNKQIVIVGNGRLVGKPLAKMWRQSGLEVLTLDKQVDDLASQTKQADILICATGVAGLIKQDMIKKTAVLVDAGVATDSNGLVGDIAADVRELPDITITPEKGGVGPLTVCALFDNVIRAARESAKQMATIGVFDSGVGGQRFVNVIQGSFPDSKIIYKTDTANLPYGNKTKEQLHALVLPILESMVKEGCEVIVIACNTVTTVLIEDLRAELSVPLVGVEPMVKVGAAKTKTGVITVCATPATLASERYKYLKETFAPNITMLEPDCSRWAGMIESNQVDVEAIRNLVVDSCNKGSDVIVLGCTHYHWIEELISRAADGRAEVIQPELPVVTQLQKVLGQDR